MKLPGFSLRKGELNEAGECRCYTCNKKNEITSMELCTECEKFSCRPSCVRYRRQAPYGYICLRCLNKLKKK